MTCKRIQTVTTILATLTLASCDSSNHNEASVNLTPSTIRADRRAYDGAPPVIPHKPLGAACTTCHTRSGKQVPKQGFAPANPHLSTKFESAAQNCRQCHLFSNTTDQFVDSTFEGVRQTLRSGEALYNGAPPFIPHDLLMRENCSACHSGKSSRPEIRCTHPERKNCRQCHVLPKAKAKTTNLSR